MLRHLAFVRLSVNFFCFRLTPPTVYIRSLGIWLDHDGATHIVSGGNSPLNIRVMPL